MKLPVYVYAAYDEYSKEWGYTTGPEGMETVGWVPVAKWSVEFDTLPRDVLQSGTVAHYRAEQQRIRAEAEMKVSKLEQTIRDMQCLEDRREVAA